LTEPQGLATMGMHWRILGEIADVETLAGGSGIREIARLRKRYARSR